jgi:hypothetical protein
MRTGRVSRFEPSGRSKSGAVDMWQTATLETEICGQRLSTARAANEPRRRPKRLSRPTDAAASRGNVVIFCGGGNHVGLRGLRGGAEGIRTDGHRAGAVRSRAIPPFAGQCRKRTDRAGIGSPSAAGRSRPRNRPLGPSWASWNSRAGFLIAGGAAVAGMSGSAMALSMRDLRPLR